MTSSATPESASCERLIEPLINVVPLIASLPIRTRPLVLICDDEELVQDVLAYHLSKQGYEVKRANDGPSALACMRERLPAVVILAILLPGMTGTEVLQRIRETPDCRKVPVMMLTYRNLEQDIVEAFRLGASDYVTKPFIIPEVLARVSKLIRPHQHPLESLPTELAA